MPHSSLSRLLILPLFLVAAACAQPEKQTKGTPPLTDGEGEAPPASTGEPIPESDVNPDRAKAFEECWDYARSQVRADQQIDSDISGRTGRGDLGGDYRAFQRNIKPYEYEQRQKRLFNDCLRRRGYAPE